MKRVRHQAEPGTERGQRPSGPGRRGFLRQAGLATLVVGGLEMLGMPEATAATGQATSEKHPIVPPTESVGPVYPLSGKPGPDAKASVGRPAHSGSVTWYRSPGYGGSGCPDSEGSYFWYDSSNGQYGGPVYV
jgi:hypothetical protein